MAVTSIEIRNYEYYIFSSRGPSDIASAIILLFQEENNRRIASLFFTKDDQTMIPAGYAQGRYTLAYTYADLPVLIDMLRNETPVFLIVDPTGAVDNWRVSTGGEPVGEGEH